MRIQGRRKTKAKPAGNTYACWNRSVNRIELIRLIVLNEICDDYENVDQIILQGAAKEGAAYGLTIDRRDVVAALGWLIEQGLAKAYLLSSLSPHHTELHGMPQLDMIEENFQTYFYIAKKGMEHHLSRRDSGPPLGPD